MGLGGISIWQLLIILAIVVMLFGTKRLRSLGSDLGAAIKGFRSSMQGEESEQADSQLEDDDATETQAAQQKEKADSTQS
jgi:sec-independent protein translocase protein TatA